MLSKKMQDALNAQINAEGYSAYLYLAMAVQADAMNLKGFAHWFRVQYQEETGHMLKILGYILERRGEVELKAIEASAQKWDTVEAMFEATLKHEQHVTSLIHNLATVAAAEKDPATGIFLQWFITEQVEEESTADEILQQLRMIKGAPAGLLMLDRHLAQRGG
jgi:ferritin